MKKKYTIDELTVGMRVMRDFPVSNETVREFARISKDTNPLHLDEAYARNTVFKKPLVHGMLVGSFISSVIATGMPGEGSIYMGQNLKFLKPVFHGDMITVEVTVASINREKEFVILTTDCYNQDHVKVISGEATVRPGR